MRAEIYKAAPSPILGMRILIALLISLLGATVLSGCATTTNAPVATILEMKVAKSLRGPCVRPALPSDELLAELAASDATRAEGQFWMPREADWEMAMATCEARGDALMLAIDDYNSISAALKTAVEKKKGWFQ